MSVACAAEAPNSVAAANTAAAPMRVRCLGAFNTVDSSVGCAVAGPFPPEPYCSPSMLQ